MIDALNTPRPARLPLEAIPVGTHHALILADEIQLGNGQIELPTELCWGTLVVLTRTLRINGGTHIEFEQDDVPNAYREVLFLTDTLVCDRNAQLSVSGGGEVVVAYRREASSQPSVAPEDLVRPAAEGFNAAIYGGEFTEGYVYKWDEVRGSGEPMVDRLLAYWVLRKAEQIRDRLPDLERRDDYQSIAQLFLDYKALPSVPMAWYREDRKRIFETLNKEKNRLLPTALSWREPCLLEMGLASQPATTWSSSGAACGSWPHRTLPCYGRNGLAIRCSACCGSTQATRASPARS